MLASIDRYLELVLLDETLFPLITPQFNETGIFSASFVSRVTERFALLRSELLAVLREVQSHPVLTVAEHRVLDKIAFDVLHGPFPDVKESDTMLAIDRKLEGVFETYVGRSRE